jgi:uncharacterized protein
VSNFLRYLSIRISIEKIQIQPAMYKEIQDFLSSKAIAIVGASHKKNEFSHMLLAAFVEKGFIVYPVNPNCQEIEGLKTYPSIAVLPNDVEAVYIIKRKDLAIDMAREAANKGIKKIWIHVKCNSPEVKELSKEFGITIIAGECFFMWAEPVKGFHKFHRFIRSIFDSNVQ